MSAPTISTGRTWVDGETVTPSRVNETVNSATLHFTKTNVIAGRSTAGAGAAEEIDCTATGRAVMGATDAAAARTAIGADTMSTQAADAVNITGGKVKAPFFAAAADTLAFASTRSLDFSNAAATLQKLTLTGNITFTTSGLAAGAVKVLRITGDSVSRTLTFPAGWTFYGSAVPSTLAASKKARLTLESWGTTDADVSAFYVAEP